MIGNEDKISSDFQFTVDVLMADGRALNQSLAYKKLLDSCNIFKNLKKNFLFGKNTTNIPSGNLKYFHEMIFL